MALTKTIFALFALFTVASSRTLKYTTPTIHNNCGHSVTGIKLINAQLTGEDAPDFECDYSNNEQIVLTPGPNSVDKWARGVSIVAIPELKSGDILNVNDPNPSGSSLGESCYTDGVMMQTFDIASDNDVYLCSMTSSEPTPSPSPSPEPTPSPSPEPYPSPSPSPEPYPSPSPSPEPTPSPSPSPEPEYSIVTVVNNCPGDIHIYQLPLIDNLYDCDYAIDPYNSTVGSSVDIVMESDHPELNVYLIAYLSNDNLLTSDGQQFNVSLPHALSESCNIDFGGFVTFTDISTVTDGKLYMCSV
ncbi:hypothetical protein PBCVMA1E_076R [Paramecium bursaria Chlorella virus MA1E]|nr:hypothetical protein PBCVMA1E_076R [Paramecium bursaria Chlorella virus MA1E]